MEEMNLFRDTQQPQERDRKENLIHYQGELGDFWYDPKKFEVCHNYDCTFFDDLPEGDYLHYVGHDLSISLPKGCINTRGMFYKCKLSEGFTLGDNFDTSKVEDMENMFYKCNLPAGFPLGDKFDTSNVKNMNYMFEKCNFSSSFSLGDKFNTSNVTDMSSMFKDCKLPTGFSLGAEFDTSNVEDMSYMFANAKLPEGFTLGDKFDTSNVKVIAYMFGHCIMPDDFYLEKNFTIPSIDYNDLVGMFDDCRLPMDTDEDDFSEYDDIVSWLQQQKYIVLGENIPYQGELGDFSYDPEEFEVRDCYYWDCCGGIDGSDYLHYIGHGLSVSLPKGCINIRGMFYKCELPEGFTLGDNFDTSKVEGMENMFYQCKLPAGFSLGDKFDTSNVKNMVYMFRECEMPEGFALDDKFDTSNVIDMESMFDNCVLPEGFTLGVNFNVSNVTNTDNMFSDCALPEGRSLKDFNESPYSIVSWLQQRKYYLQGKEKAHYEGALGNFDYDPREFIITHAENYDECLHYHGSGNSISLPKGCTNMRHMFEGCDLPEGFRLDNIDTSEVVDMSYMFYNCKLPAGFSLGDGFDTARVKYMGGMFQGCEFPQFFTLGDKFNTSSVIEMYSMFESCVFPEGFSLGDKFYTSKVFDMAGMFANAKLPEDFTLGEKFTFGTAINLSNMFYCVEFPKVLSLNDFTFTANRDYADMFSGCKFPAGFWLGGFPVKQLGKIICAFTSKIVL